MWQEQKRLTEQQEAQRKKQEEDFFKQVAERDPGKQKNEEL